jgi:hypothetical protein
MNHGRLPTFALDSILRQTRHLLIAFEGPVHPISSDASAPPPAHLHDLITSSRETGRTTSVITSAPAQTVDAYLATHGLDTQITAVFASRNSDPAEVMSMPRLIEKAAEKLGANLADCALVTSTAADTEVARTAGSHTIGYWLPWPARIMTVPGRPSSRRWRCTRPSTRPTPSAGRSPGSPGSAPPATNRPATGRQHSKHRPASSDTTSSHPWRPSSKTDGPSHDRRKAAAPLPPFGR